MGGEGLYSRKGQGSTVCSISTYFHDFQDDRFGLPGL